MLEEELADDTMSVSNGVAAENSLEDEKSVVVPGEIEADANNAEIDSHNDVDVEDNRNIKNGFDAKDDSNMEIDSEKGSNTDVADMEDSVDARPEVEGTATTEDSYLVRKAKGLIQSGSNSKDGWKTLSGILKKVVNDHNEMCEFLQFLMHLPERELALPLEKTSEDDIDLSGIPFKLKGDDEMLFLNNPVVAENCFDASGLSLKRLMVRTTLDAVVPMFVQSASKKKESLNVDDSIMKLAIAEANKPSDDEDTHKDNTQKEDSDKMRRRKRAAKSCCAGVQMQIAILHNKNLSPVVHETFDYSSVASKESNDKQCWPFSENSLLEIAGHAENGTVDQGGRNPSLITGSEHRIMLLQLEEFYAEKKKKFKARTRKNKLSLQNVLSGHVKTAIDGARSVFGSFSPGEVGKYDVTQVDPDAHDVEEDEKDIAATLKDKLDQSKSTTANNRSVRSKDTLKHHFFATDDANDILLEADSCATMAEKMLNDELKAPYCCVLPQGRAFRMLAGLDADGPERASDLGQVECECVVLMDGDRAKELSEMRAEGKKPHAIGPTVVGQRCVTAKDATRAILHDLNKQRFICDSQQTNGGMMRCAFIAHDPESDRMPIAHIGKSKGTVAMPASTLEEACMKCKEMKQAMAINCTNHFTCQILGCEEPQPDIGPPVHKMEEFWGLAKRHPENSHKFVITDKKRARDIWEPHYTPVCGVSLNEALGIATTDDDSPPSVEDPNGSEAIVGADDSASTSEEDSEASRNPNQKKKQRTGPLRGDKRRVSEVLRTSEKASKCLVPGQRINLTAYNVRITGGFSAHQDRHPRKGNQFVTDPFKRECSCEEKAIAWPTPDQMVVSTTVACIEKCGDKSTVHWIRGSRRSEAANLGCLLTDGSTEHVQRCEVQTNQIFHCAKSCGLVNALNIEGVRVSMTGRCVKDPMREPDQFLKAHAMDGLVKEQMDDPNRSFNLLRRHEWLDATSGNPVQLPEENVFDAKPHYECDWEEAKHHKLQDDSEELNPHHGMEKEDVQRARVRLLCPTFLSMSPEQHGVFHQHSLPVLVDAGTGVSVAVDKTDELWGNVERPTNMRNIASQVDTEEKFADGGPNIACGTASVEDVASKHKKNGIVQDTDRHGVRGLLEPVKLVGLDKFPGDAVCLTDVQNILLRHGVVATVCDDQNQRKLFQPLRSRHDRPMLPNTLLGVDELPLEVTDCTNAITNPESPNVFMQAQFYKNLVATSEEHEDFWGKWLSKSREILDNHDGVSIDDAVEHPSWEDLYDGLGALGPVSVFCSGGSTQLSGAKCVALSSAKMDTCHCGTATAQDPSTQINSAIYGMLTTGNPVAMCVNKRTVHKHVNEGHSEKAGKPVICLKHCTACSSRAGRHGMHEVFDQTESKHFEGSQQRRLDHVSKDMMNFSFHGAIQNH